MEVGRREGVLHGQAIACSSAEMLGNADAHKQLETATVPRAVPQRFLDYTGNAPFPGALQNWEDAEMVEATLVPSFAQGYVFCHP